MNPVLCIGDLIIDQWKKFTATRICLEAPVPILVPVKHDEDYCDCVEETHGGAGLVVSQLGAMHLSVHCLYGSVSRKERIIADDRLVCRLDYDSLEIHNWFPAEVLKRIDEHIFDLLIISDYGKGSFTSESADKIMQAAKKKNLPVLVDAKHNWEWYRSAFAFFPNEHERFNSTHLGKSHIIQKRGALGCLVDGVEVPSEKVQIVRDTTGAGDVFIAAFAARLLEHDKKAWPKDSVLVDCAKFANRIAGISVMSFGTHVVTKEEIDGLP